MTDRYAVIGNPVEHSKSPWIHARFAEQTGEAIEYGAIRAPKDAFAADHNGGWAIHAGRIQAHFAEAARLVALCRGKIHAAEIQVKTITEQLERDLTDEDDGPPDDQGVDQNIRY